MANENNETKRDLTVLSNGLATSDSEYVRLLTYFRYLGEG